MPADFIKIKQYPGVYYRESKTQKHNGKPSKCFYITFKDQTNKTVTEKVGSDFEGYSVALAVQIRSEKIRALRHGEILPKKKAKEVTLGEVWQKYDVWLETNKARPKDDRFLYKNHLKDRFEKKRLSEIAPLDLERMKADLKKKGLADASIRHCLVLLRQLFNKAVAWGMWKGESPTKLIRMPKLNNAREKFFTREQAEELLDYLATISTQLHDMALLSLHTGLRAGEIFSLKWGHVDLENGLIHVADPKGGTARKAFMTGPVKDMFQARKPEENHAEEYVFMSTKGEKVMEVSNAFAKAIEKLGFNEGVKDTRQKLTFHSLRHTFASWLALNGTPILTIKELMGHATLAMTERYSHLMPDTKKEAVNQLEQYFQEKPEGKGEALRLV